MKPPVFSIDLEQFWKDPYPELALMRQHHPICYVPELDAVLLTKRNDIFKCEKMVDVFSSVQPNGLMTQLMGENMMRKDGDEHMLERRQAQPSVSPRTVKETWVNEFRFHTLNVLDELEHRSGFDIVTDFAMPVSAHALRHITGLLNLSTQEMDEVSQAMIDGVANYANNATAEQRCNEATALIDNAIDTMLPTVNATPNASLLSVLTRANQPMESVRANIKLAISGGQNEPRDAIAGAAWALLKHADQRRKLAEGKATWLNVFEEYARWMSPIGMSPRRVAKAFQWNSVDFEPESKTFFMFGSANRDEAIFEHADSFDITRNNSKSVSFGAGPHFCAGAAASRSLIADVALPMLFERFPSMELTDDVEFGGWAFRGPLTVPVQHKR